MASRNYKDLIAWQKAKALVIAIYRMTESFPRSEQFGLISQMRRSAVSIPSNIAEGSRRGTVRDFQHFLQIAYGSGAELETQIEIVKEFRWGSVDEHTQVQHLLDDVMRLLNRLIISMNPRLTKND